jgi:hypothetical protein
VVRGIVRLLGCVVNSQLCVGKREKQLVAAVQVQENRQFVNAVLGQENGQFVSAV